MYSSEREPDILQGDVFGGFEFKEFLDYTVGSRESGGQKVSTSNASWRLVTAYIAIVSHSCDTTLANKAKRERVVVAPLIVPDEGKVRTIKEKLGDLEALDRVPEPGKTEFLNLFYYAPHELLGGVLHLIDFSNLRSIKSDQLRIEAKLVELADPARKAFRMRLGFHFARKEDDGQGTQPPQ